MKKEPGMLPYITALITSFIFGMSFFFSVKALSVADPFMLMAFRFLTAFLVMTLLIILKVIKVSYKGKPIKWLVLLSLIEPVIYFVFETYGLKRTSSSLGGLMISLIPIAVTILAAYFLGEKPTLKQITFIVTSVAGVILIVISGGSDGKGSSVIGVFLLLGAVLSAAFFNIISRRSSRYFTPMEITYFMMFLGALSFNIILIISHVLKGDLISYFEPLKSSTFVTSILYLGILSSIVAYFLINYSLSKLQASKTSVFSNISTIVSIAAGVFFLGESFSIYHAVGAVMILLGVWGTNYFG